MKWNESWPPVIWFKELIPSFKLFLLVPKSCYFSLGGKFLNSPSFEEEHCSNFSINVSFKSTILSSTTGLTLSYMSDFYALWIKKLISSETPYNRNWREILFSTKRSHIIYLLFPPKRPNMPREDSWISRGVPSTVVPACITRFLKVRNVLSNYFSNFPERVSDWLDPFLFVMDYRIRRGILITLRCTNRTQTHGIIAKRPS